MTDRLVRPQGTLELVIFRAVTLEPLHGWALSEQLHVDVVGHVLDLA